MPTKKLLGLYPVVKSNSRNQYKVALILADAGHYGQALPHLLVSTEELIKALVIVLDAKGFKLRKIRGMDVFFKNHEIRFFIAYFMFAIGLFGDDLMRWLPILRKNSALLVRFMRNKKRRDIAIKWYCLRKFVTIREEIKWFSRAEVLRQNGFYVDMKNELISPAHITKHDFEEAKKRIKKVNVVTQGFIDSFLSPHPSTITQVKLLQRTLSTRKFRNSLEKGLVNMRKGRKSFFQELIDKLIKDISDKE